MNRDHINILEKGVENWNKWRSQNPNIKPILKKANVRHLTLKKANFSNCDMRNLIAGGGSQELGVNFLGANFSGADLTGADLRSAILRHANFTKATLVGVNLTNANLYNVNFERANLHKLDLWGSLLTKSDLSEADMTESRLRGTSFINCKLNETNLSRSLVFGCSAWKLDLTNACQEDLVVTEDNRKQKWLGTSDSSVLEKPIITVDNLEIAQFMFLLLNNNQIRNVINTIGKKAVLILGRFSAERKTVLDALRIELRKYDWLPIMFDFQQPDCRGLIETVKMLANLSRFVIADLTDARAVPEELVAIVPNFPSVPVSPILEDGSRIYQGFEDISKNSNVLPVFRYRDPEMLLGTLKTSVIDPSDRKATEITC